MGTDVYFLSLAAEKMAYLSMKAAIFHGTIFKEGKKNKIFRLSNVKDGCWEVSLGVLAAFHRNQQ